MLRCLSLLLLAGVGVSQECAEETDRVTMLQSLTSLEDSDISLVMKPTAKKHADKKEADTKKHADKKHTDAKKPDAKKHTKKHEHWKPPGPNPDGLTRDDKDYITDDQGGPFYKTTNPPPKRGGPSAAQLAETVAIDTTLCGMVLLVLVLLSFVSSRSAGVQKGSWGIFSGGIAVFMGYMIFRGVKELLKYWLTSSGAVFTVGIDIAILLETFVIIQIILFAFRTKPEILVGTGTLGSYIMSFAAIDVFGMVLEMISKSNWVLAGTIILAAVVIASFAFFTNASRAFLELCVKSDAARPGQPASTSSSYFDWLFVAAQQPAWDRWKEQAYKCDEQFIAVTVGYLISQAVEFLIHRGLAATSTTFNFYMLLMSIISFVLAGVCLAMWTISSAGTRDIPGDTVNKYSLTCLKLVLMTAAWCTFHAAEWQVAGDFGKYLSLNPHTPRATLVTALFLSLLVTLSFLLISIYSASCHENPFSVSLSACFSALSNALGLLVGVAWVTCFVTVLPTIASWFPYIYAPIVFFVALLLGVVVLPIWAFYVLPAAVDAQEIAPVDTK